jgi:Dolichyl-phosphate-mannose-protein mannosyltransferase
VASQAAQSHDFPVSKSDQSQFAEFQLPRWFSVAVACLLLAMMAWLAGGAARRESVVIDEVAHIGAGLSYWQQLDLRLNEEHPPLGKLIAALPLALHGTKADYSQISWTISAKFLQGYLGQWIFGTWVLQHWNDYPSTLWWARMPMLGLTLLMGWVVFRFGKRLGGDWGGLLALTAFVTTPTFLTFGPLVLTDIPVTFFVLLTLWSMGELWHSPSRRNMWIFAIWLAAALLSKFSSLVLFVVIPAFALSLRFRPVGEQPADRIELKAWRKLRAWKAWQGIGWALMMVYVFYFVFSIRQPTNALYFLGHNVIAMAARRMLLPFALFFRGLGWLLLTASRPTFLLGHQYPHGVWFYFPIAFLLKSALAFLLLLALALVLWSGRKVSGKGRVIPADAAYSWRGLWVGFWAFTIVCLLSRLTISIRHFSFSIVLLIVFLSPLPRMIAALRPKARYGLAAVAAGLAVSCIVTAVRTYPNYFPFINSLGFGKPGYELMSDSNVDWNQALPQAEEWVRQHGIQRIGIDEYGFTDPAESVPGSYVWDCQLPKADEAGQWEIISANEILDQHNCAWLLSYPREEIAAGSMYAVKLPNPIPEAGAAGGPPTAGEIRSWLGFPGDFRVTAISMEHDPGTIPKVLTDMEAQFQEQMKKAQAKQPSVPKILRDDNPR